MAGLVLAITEAPLVARGLVDRGLREMLHLPGLRALRLDVPHFSIALVLPAAVKPTLWHAAGDGSVVAIHGEIYPDDEPIIDPGKVAARIQQTLDSGDAAALARSNGLFNIVTWSPERRTCHLINDVVGPLLLFCGEIPGGRIVASEPGPIELLAGRGPDRAGIASLLKIGYQADDRTAVSGVTTLPSGTVLRYAVQSGRIEEQRTRVVSIPDGRERQKDEVAMIEDAVRLRCFGASVCLPLSGGEDSRLLAGIVSRAELAVEAVTLAGGCQVADARVATQVAKQLDLRHRVVPTESRSLAEHLGYMATAFSSTMDWHGAIYLPLFRAIEPGQTILLGFLGGALAGANVGVRAPNEEDLRRIAEAHYRYDQTDPPFPRNSTSPQIPLCPAQIPIVGQEDLPAELLMNLYGRQRRYTSHLLRLAWNFGRPVCPFADARLLARACASSRAQLAGRHKRRLDLCTAFPALGRMESGNDLLPLRSHQLRRLRSMLSGTAVSRLVRRMFPRFSVTYDSSRLRQLFEGALVALGDRQRLLVQRFLAPGSMFGGMALIALAASASSNLDETATLIREELS